MPHLVDMQHCQRWILGEVNKAVTSGPPFSEMPWGPSLKVSHLVFALLWI